MDGPGADWHAVPWRGGLCAGCDTESRSRAGVPGELCIGGGGVAVGYWNDAPLTAQKFAPDPWSGTAGARLYRTGDRARWNRAGQLELLGRRDDQFKLRGFRIEPAEIEACITALPGVVAAAAGLHDGSADGEPRLVVWLVPRGEPVPREHWQRALRRQLPEHLVPAAFLWLPALPLTPNGKVDRAALALRWRMPYRRVVRTRAVRRDAAAPATAVSRPWSAQLFADCTRRRRRSAPTRISFARGGHSLLATRLVARLREALQVDVPAAHGVRVADAPWARGGRGQVGVPRCRAGARPSRQRAAGRPAATVSRCSTGSGSSSACNRVPAPITCTGSCACAGLSIRAALQAAVDALVAPSRGAAHRFRRAGRRARPAVRPARVPPAQRVPTAAVKRYRATDRDALCSPPRLRSCESTLLAHGAEDHRLLVVMHHLVADGWSFSVLSRELAAVYNAARQGECSAVGTAAAAIRGLRAAGSRTRVHGGRLELQLAFWRVRHWPARRRCWRCPPPAPAGRGQLAGRVGRASRAGAETVAALRELALAQGCTLFMVLLAGFKVVLGRLAGVG